LHPLNINLLFKGCHAFNALVVAKLFLPRQGRTMPSLKKNWVLPLLLLAFALFYLAPLAFHGLWIPDETRYAQISQEMLTRGQWATPHFMGLRYFEKPAGGYWMIAIGQAIFGQNLFGVRIASALSLGLSVLLAYRMAERMWGDWRTSFACAVVFMSLALIAAGAGYANLDPQFTLWMNLAGVALWYATDSRGGRARLAAWVLLGVACGMGFLTKGFLALLLPVLVAVPYMVWQRRLLELLRFGPVSVVVAVAIALPWALTINAQEADFWRYFFWDEHIRRFAGNDAQHAQAWWYYLPLLVVCSLPWIALLPNALRQGWRLKVAPAHGFIALWFLLPLVFFSIAKGKLPSYIMPCMLPLALLIGHSLAAALRAGKLRLLRCNVGLNVAFGVAGLVAVVVMQVKRPIYIDEPGHLALTLLAIGGWILLNALALWRPGRLWAAPAAAMGLVLALLPAALPSRVVHNKTPEVFIAAHASEIAGARHLLSNELGTASALAWHTGNPDVTLYNTGGETRYGLSYPDAEGRAVSLDNVQAWMANARKDGRVVVALRIKDSGAQQELDLLPSDGKRYQKGSVVILLYEQVR
jgi:4-amino-4-deoxy-L-arabinose transferase